MNKAPTVQAGAVSGVVDQSQCSNLAGQSIPLTLDRTPETLPTNLWLPTAAHRYARLGFKIGPLNGKVPMTPNGFKDFTTDLEQVTAWWERHPGANIGATPPKGMVVLDIDPRNGGCETWQQLNAGHRVPIR